MIASTEVRHDIKLRVSTNLKRKLDAAREKNRRKLNDEIVARLEASFLSAGELGTQDNLIADIAQLRAENTQLKSTIDVLQKIIIDIAKKAG